MRVCVCVPVFLASVGVTLSGLRCCFVCAGGLSNLKCDIEWICGQTTVSGIGKSLNSNAFCIVLATWIVSLLMLYFQNNEFTTVMYYFVFIYPGGQKSNNFWAEYTEYTLRKAFNRTETLQESKADYVAIPKQRFFENYHFRHVIPVEKKK